MQRWALFALLCVVFAVAVQANTCDRFDIRHHGQTLFAITSGDGLVSIPGDLELGSVAANQILMGDYVFGVHNVFGEAQLGLRKRRVDADTGKYHVPRAIRGFAHNGTHVIYDHEFRDATEFSLAELRDFMREVLADELALEGHNDPFNLAARYTAAGEWCKDQSFDCISTRDDMFVMVSSEESRIAMLDLQAMWERDPEAGEEGYTGEVQRLTLIRTNDDYQTLSNENGKIPGRAGFRLADSEVEEVFYLKAGHVEDFEVTPGVKLSIHGWAGGNVIDFTFGSDGSLSGGKIVVGPHPESDPNDVVVMQKSGFVGLETRTPGPALRFTPGRATRVYVHNNLVHDDSDSQPLSVRFGFLTRHDQDGEYQFSQQAFSAASSPYVYEFVVPAEGSHVYYDSYLWNDALSGAGVIAEASWDHDREYVLVAQSGDMLNGNTFPGTAKRLSGWYRDTIRIKESKVDPDTKDTIVTIIDEVRLPYEGSNDDPLHPVVENDCPAYGGPLRYGTGCWINGVHQHRGHNIPSATFSPGTPVMIEGHGDQARSSINGVHYVARESLTSFRIKKIGEEGSSGGVGGFVHIWRLHKSSPHHPELQNNGASGAYLRFNYGESVLLRVFNADSQPAHVHIHGHKFEVVAENGFTLGATRGETSYSVPAGNTADLMLMADNPNRINAWLLANDIQAESDIALPSPWQDAHIMGTGHATFVDYTGKAQGDLVLNADGAAVPLSWLPPVCTVETETLDVVRDSIGWTVGEGDDIWVWLGGAGEFAINPWTNEPFGDHVTYQWAVESMPEGVETEPTFFTPEEASTYVVDLANGEYVFTLTVTGRNAAQTNPAVHVSCQKKITVRVCADEAACADSNDLDTLPDTFVSPAITTVSLGVDVTSASAKRATVKSVPAATGHATFKLHSAGHLSVGNTLTLKEFYAVNPINPTGAWDPQDPNPFSPLHTGRDFKFYRWANQGSNTDFWLSIDPAVSTNRAEWSFAIKQVVFDSRVQTFGYVLAADIGADVAAGAQPPAHSKVYYPMYQGSSTARGSVHDVYFLILEASDEEFCALYNCVYAPTLSLIPLNSGALNSASVSPAAKNQYIAQRKNTGTFADQRATNFLFTVDPTLIPVTSLNPTDDADTPQPFAYSPLKYISWTTSTGVVKHVIANMPFVYWGNLDVQAPIANAAAATTFAADLRDERRMLLVESDPTSSDCDDFVPGAAYRPESFASTWTGVDFDPSGPPGCGGAVLAADRQRGGQMLAIPDFRRMFAVFKTHRAAFDGSVVPYFTITDTSDLAESQYHGVPYTPALDKLGRFGESPYVSSYRQWGNGVAGAGLLGFQDAVVASIPAASSWTPFWQLTNLYWNCGTYSFSTKNVADRQLCWSASWGSTVEVSCPDGSVITGFDFAAFGLPTGSCESHDWALGPACTLDGRAVGTINCAGNQKCSVTASLAWWNLGAERCAPAGDDYMILVPTCSNLADTVTRYDILPTVNDIYLKGDNIAFTPALVPASATTDAYMLTSNLKSSSCPTYVKANTGSTWTRATDIPALLAKGVLFETDNPPGTTPTAAKLASPSILNAHIPYVFRPAAPKETEDLVEKFAIIDDYPVIPGTWFFQGRTALGTVSLAFRPLISGATQYMQKDYGLWGDFPPSEPLVAAAPGAQNCPNCAWRAIYDDGSLVGAGLWIGQQSSFFRDLSKHVFRLDAVTPSQVEPPKVIKYSLLECNDATFAAAFGARYVPELPANVATSSVWWSEPKPDDAGRYTPASVASALGSFVFSEVPGAVGPSGVVNALYTPLKMFTFRNKWITCNMPFAVWGTAPEQRLVTDNGDCNDLISKDWYGSKYTFFAGGPPTCDDEVHPLQRVLGGQAVHWAADWSTVTLKLHRTVNANNKKWSYYTIWDTTNAIEADYYGIPVSPRIAAATATGVEWMKIFANGWECEGCNPFNFQDPIIGTGLSPIRKVTNLLWNCNNVLQSGDLFTASNYDGTACANDKENIDCDNYPLRVNLKWVECAAYVQRFAPSGVVYATDNLTQWITDKVVFETLSPVGVPTSRGPAEMTNSPVVLTVDFN